jgi:5'-3' exonuclease
MTIALIDADCTAHAIGWLFRKTQDIDKAYNSFKKKLREIQEAVWADDSLIAVKGPYNYRDVVYPLYKSTRKSNPDTVDIVRACRSRAIEDGLAIPSTGREADDFLRIWSNEAKAIGEDFIICSGDKDLHCIPGRHYNLKTEVVSEVSEADGMRHYWAQVIAGDPVDTIPGIPRVAMKTALKLLLDCNTEEEFRDRTRGIYKLHYKEEWHSWLLSNLRMIHIQEHLNDYPSFR